MKLRDLTQLTDLGRRLRESKVCIITYLTRLDQRQRTNGSEPGNNS